MLYPSELRARWRHYRRFVRSFYGAFGGFAANSRVISSFVESHLLFFSPFLMFVSPLALFARAMQQGHGWTLAKTTAKTHAHKPTKL
jgi:hypothetical protein